jgi:hypothetical protein
MQAAGEPTKCTHKGLLIYHENPKCSVVDCPNPGKYLLMDKNVIACTDCFVTSLNQMDDEVKKKLKLDVNEILAEKDDGKYYGYTLCDGQLEKVKLTLCIVPESAFD